MPRIRQVRTGAAATARARHLTQHAAKRARRARREIVLVVPLIAAVLAAYTYRNSLFGVDVPVRVGAAIAMVMLGYALARDLGRLTRPALFRRMDVSTAGTVEFLIRLFFLLLTVLVSLRVLGLRPATLAVGGAITAVVFGLAAQQTLGNLIAGLVLLSARPFRVGERIRLQAGGLAGTMEGDVASLGLLYTTLRSGQERILVPNTVVLSSAIVPLREPPSVDLRARLRRDVRPSDLQELLNRSVRTQMRSHLHIGVEEVDSDEVVVRVAATPENDREGAQLADEILAALAPLTPPAQNGRSAATVSQRYDA